MTGEERLRYRLNLDNCLGDAYEKAGRNRQRLAEALGIPWGTITRWVSMNGLTHSPRTITEARVDAIDTLPDADPAEVVHLKRRINRLENEASSLRKQVKHSGEHANLVDDVADLLQPVLDRMVAPPYAPPPRLKRHADPVTLVWHLTDLHFGEIVDPATVQGVNEYTPDIAAMRVQHTLDIIRKVAEDRRGGVNKIVVAVNGDTIGGAIHPESTEYAFGVSIQTVAAAELLAQVGVELAHTFDEVEFLGTVGNHPRSQTKQPTGRALVETSWEYLIHRHAKALMRDLANVEYKIASGYVLDTYIGPSRWAFSHGDAARGGGGQLGIPAYGLKKQHDAAREWSLVLAELTDLTAASVVKHSRYGHFHTLFQWHAGHADIALAPSPKGPDTYVMHTLGKYSPPMFLLEIVHPEHDLIGSVKVDLTRVIDTDALRWDWTRRA